MDAADWANMEDLGGKGIDFVFTGRSNANSDFFIRCQRNVAAIATLLSQVRNTYKISAPVVTRGQ